MDVIRKATNMIEVPFEEAKKLLLEGATEKDMVYSGLDEVMTTASQECIDISLKHNVDLRMAAYLNAIFKLNDFFNTIGSV